MSAATTMIYAYGVLWNRPRAKVMGSANNQEGSETVPLRVLPCGEIATLVSDLSVPDGMSFKELLQDRQRAEDMILGHHGVLERFAGRHTLLPFRFGTVFADEERLMAVLKADYDALLAALDRVDGAVEWGLKIFCDRDALARHLVTASSEIRNLQQDIAAAGDGKAFFLRRRLERLQRDEVEDALERCLSQMEARLAAAAQDVAAGRIQPSEVHGHRHDMVFHRAYLVDRGLEGQFFHLIDDLRAAYTVFGFGFESTGPWPPYNFVNYRIEGGDHPA